MPTRVLVIGAGLAGAEAAYFLARQGISVLLVESKVIQKTPAQKETTAAELVCTNSLKSLDPHSSHGILKTEMKALGSVVLEVAMQHQVPAGGALAVDREKFSAEISAKLKSHPLIEWQDAIVENPIDFMQKNNCTYGVVASGPLTLLPLENWIKQNVSSADLYFYDAIAPVVDADTLGYDKLYFKDRYATEGEGHYLNAPMNKEQYENFIEALKIAEKVPPKNFEEYKFFEGCLPIDTMAERGMETARFSCMKPVGLELPDGTEPYAVVQLRKENLLGNAYNLVGFQTRLTYGAQKEVFKLIPGFENAEFFKWGSVHRNSFLNSRELLSPDLSVKKYPHLFFAGQITGVEGYTESASIGLYVAFQILKRIQKENFILWPKETGVGALVHYLMTMERASPSSINFGLFPDITLNREQRKNPKRKKIKGQLIAERAKLALNGLIEQNKNYFLGEAL